MVIALLIAAAGGLLSGPSGRAQVLVFAALVVVAMSLGVFLSLRKTKHVARELEPKNVAETGQQNTPSRSVLPFAMGGGALVAATVLVAVFVAEGEARGHVFFHLVFGVALLLLFTAVGLMWRYPANTASSTGRTVLLFGLWISAAGTLLESIGAGGYDALNQKTRIEWLTAIHGITTPIASIGLLMIPLGGITLAILVLRTLLAHRGRKAQADR
ncbi:MAG: hypothetical protein M3Q18_00655 [Actinomycetota bacterium]|nr:hypothetical protein [Actinomycetota bacterium]